MGNTIKNKRASVIAFYLPQFHPIPENNDWWGEGFTEWVNVRKAKPLFKGHYQPRIPADLGYYDLRVPEIREAQAQLARAYGIEAFCYWHYWFAGHRLLERPFNEVIQSGKPNFPFCLGWANQTWSGIWHGAPDRILIEQTYPGYEDYKEHFYALLPAFRDERYYRIKNKLVFLIYAPMLLPSSKEFTSYWQELAVKVGLPEFHFIAHLSNNAEEFGCQSSVAGAPFASMDAQKMHVDSFEELDNIFDYEDLVNHLKTYKLSENEHPIVLPNWDNSPRSGENGFILHNSTPDLFKEMVEDAIIKVETKYAPAERVIFVKAWNEWAEGNYLEPDKTFGKKYLESLLQALTNDEHAPTTSNLTLPPPISSPEPWSSEYYAYRALYNKKTIETDGIVKLFMDREPLPIFFATGLDERSIELPWVIANVSKTAHHILDAGSALNHPEILNNRYWLDKELTIATLSPETNQFSFNWLTYIYSDLRQLPFETDSFDEIVCISTLEHLGMDNTLFTNNLKHKENDGTAYIEALIELRRVLRKNGRLLLTVPYGRFMNYGFFQQFDQKLLDKGAEAFGAHTRDEVIYSYTSQGWNLSNEKDRYCETLYSDYAIESLWGMKKSNIKMGSNDAVAAGAVACCIWS